MRYQRYSSGVFSVLAMLWIAVAWADNMKMPMRFTYDADPEEVLQAYPLGSLNKLAVLSHHGKADREIRLPNGRVGWVYDMSLHRVPRVYVTPSGEQQVVKEREKSGVRQIYTLVFGDDGYVADVLFEGESSGLSALQLQYHKAMDNYKEN